MKSKDSGNILFLILIAVALFAALSYAVTGTSRTSADSISSDKAKVAASVMLAHMTEIEQAITRMRLNGVAEHAFNFSNPKVYLSAGNASCGGDYCKLFHPDGGGIGARFFPIEYFDTSITGGSFANARKYYFRSIEVTDVGSSADDLVLSFNAIQAPICDEINKKMGIAAASVPNDTVSSGTVVYRGTLTEFPEGTAILGDEAAELKGRRTFCAYHSATFGNVLHHVLLAR